jgi:hypothetical protein
MFLAGLTALRQLKTQTIIYISKDPFSPDDQTLLIKIFAKDFKKFKRPFSEYKGQPVLVTGLIKMIEKTPQIVVTSEENLMLQAPPPLEIVN